MKTKWGRGMRASAWVLVGLLTLGVPGSGLSLAAEQGSALTVASDPVGAAVYVDGKLQGQTPLSLAGVAAGDHRVKVVKDGYLENSRLVTVRAGQPGSLNVHLTPGASNMRMQVDDQPSTGAAPAEPKKGGGGGKIALIALGAAAVGGGIFLALPKNKAPTASGVAANPPVALMAATPVAFSVAASDPDGDALTYNWDFGDGSSGTGANPTHVYPTVPPGGTFTVRVEVSDGKKSASATGSVTVKSMTGTWRFSEPAFGNTYDFDMSLTQNGTSFSGRAQWIHSAAGYNVTGTVRGPRNISFTDPFGGTAQGEANADIMVFTGLDSDRDTFTLTRR